VNLVGLEIDHDTGERQLPIYDNWLRRMREAMPAVPLSITALPAWLRAASLPSLLRNVDEVVLQVHAVNKPGAGLFDATQARQWMTEWADRHATTFIVALPCYGSRVVLDEHDKLVALESEVSVPVRSMREKNLMARPSDVMRLLDGLAQAAPAHLQGVMWFRLPMEQDQRAWRLSTWQAVVQGVRPWPVVQAKLVSSTTAGLFDVVLSNPSNLDLDLPRHVKLPPGLSAFGGVRGYSANLLSPQPSLSLGNDGWLRPHEQTNIGWVRAYRPLEHEHLELLDA
jgi:hypothetical protein